MIPLVTLGTVAARKYALTISTSVPSVTFGPTNILSSASSSFTVYATGSSSTTESVTITGSLDFSFSPATFTISGGGQQTVTVSYTPTSNGQKSTLSTITASGGSTKTLQVEGSTVDQYFSNVSFLLRGEGVVGSNAIVDSISPPLILTPRSSFPSGIPNSEYLSNTQVKYGSSSIYFSSNLSSVAAYDPAPSAERDTIVNKFKFQQNNFTIEFWYYRLFSSGTSNSGREPKLLNFSTRTGTSSFYCFFELAVYVNDIDLKLTTPVGNGGPSGNVSYITVPLPAGYFENGWHHIAVTRDSGTVHLYIDGIHRGSVVFNGNFDQLYPTYVYGEMLYIGANAFNSSPRNNLWGYIDDLCVTKGIARYTGTGSFTPPGAY